jgi:hypothetical protein
MNYVELKYHLLRRLEPSTFHCDFIYGFEIANVKIKLNYSGKTFLEVQNFLHTYFNHFKLLSIKDNFDVEINYSQSIDQDFGRDEWVGWNEWPHEIEVIDYDAFWGIMQRDFVAKISKDFKQLFAIGPRWSFETCDSIDNIISYVIGKHIISKEGLVLHAACVVRDSEAMVFFGRSGVGKSTIAEHSYKKYGFKVISSDQVLLKYIDGELYSIVVPTTIPEFSLDHPAREKRPIKVKAIIHLVQSGGEFNWKILSDTEFLYNFMREMVYRNEFSNEKALLDLSLKISSDRGIIKGEMSYLKNSDYYTKLVEVLDG